MKNRTSEFDLAMVTRKFYCHKCGDILVRNARTRTIKRGDPDYRKHSKFGTKRVIGDIFAEIHLPSFKLCSELKLQAIAKRETHTQRHMVVA